jgi:FkbH-like protein
MTMTAISDRVTRTVEKQSLKVTCTSNLLPGHAAWAVFDESYSLDFGHYGDWGRVLLNDGDDRFVVWVVLLADVISSTLLEQWRELDDVAIDRLLEPVVDALDNRLSQRPDVGLIVAWSVPQAGSAIESAKRRPAWTCLAERLEELLYERARRHPALYLLPIDRFLARRGVDACFDPRNFYAARCHFSAAGLRALAEQIAEIMERVNAPSRKVLVLDCDNTLWGGTVGEDGLEGLQLGQDGIGQAYLDFQSAARSLARKGLLLALASKNDEADVWQIFDGHAAMVLRRADIASYRIDWSEKSENIGAMAEELGLSLDSFVFWDDNPLEREKVRRELPQVLTPEVPPNVDAWPSLLAEMSAFARFESTTEDRDKVKQYTARRRFQKESRDQVDETDFLRSIELRPKMVAIDVGTIARAEQLCAKTNQFNLRTVRHGRAEIRAVVSGARNLAFLVHLADRFGDHGNVVLVICRETPNPAVAFLDTFLVSCRVLGRHLEAWALQACVLALRARGFRRLLAEYRPTGRNQIAADFLPEHGFVRAEGADNTALLRGAAPGVEQGAAAVSYLADLHTIVIPHLEVFDRVATNHSQPAKAAVS